MESSMEWLNPKTNNIINSGNPVVDAILQHKLYNAKDRNIEIDFCIKLSSNINIDELELGIILGNTLDNAIEAVEKISTSNSKQIEFKLITTTDRISISVKNPVEFDVDTENLITSKQNKEIHGYGIKSIQAIANKYDGIVLFSCKNKVFSANINLGNHQII
jgi:sensor histidine kinase regulating citrate/malate metabolism